MKKLNEKDALKRVVRYDAIPLLKARYTDEGYLVDTPIVTSVGIFEYKNEDGSTRRELRLPEHVFDKASLQSYKGKPIIITHDAGYITKNNVDDESVGTILSDGIPDGNDVRAQIIIHDTDELKRCGLKELSLGYSLDLIEEPGEWNGQPYDAVQTNIVVNHLALVANARAGEQARLNIDGKNEDSIKGGIMQMAKSKKSRRRDEDDLAVELANAVLEETADDTSAVDSEEEGTAEGQNSAAQPSEDLLASIRERKDRRDAEGEENAPATIDEAAEVIKQQSEDIAALLDIIDSESSGTAAAATDEGDEETNQDADEDCETDGDDEEQNADEGEEETSDAEKEGADTTKLNADSIDAIVRARAQLITLGEKYNIDGLDKLSMKAAMRKVIEAATPNLRLDSESEIKGAFKVAVSVLAARKDVNFQRKQMSSGVRLDTREKSESDTARERMIARRLKKGE